MHCEQRSNIHSFYRRHFGISYRHSDYSRDRAFANDARGPYDAPRSYDESEPADDAGYDERAAPPGISTEDLPDPNSPGAKLMVGYCTQCHNLPSPSMHTSAEWPGVAQRMFDRISILAGMSSGWMGMMRMKAPSAEQQEIMVSYLQAHALTPLGPNEIPSPDSPGAVEFKSACSQCHGLPDPKLHTADEWPAVLTRMQFNMRSMGKQVISDNEKNEIAAYLSEHAKQ